MEATVSLRAARRPTRAAGSWTRWRLFEERGFEATAVEDIAAAPMLSTHVLRYFPTKVDVLFGDHEELVGLLRETLASRDAGETIAQAVRRSTLTRSSGCSPIRISISRVRAWLPRCRRARAQPATRR